MKQRIVLPLVFLITLSFFMFGIMLGFSASSYHHFPFDIINNAKRLVIGCYDPDNYPQIFETDVKSLIKIKNEEDVIKKQELLIDFIWSGEGFPVSKLPDLVENDINDSRYSDMKNLERIDKITMIMDYEINSIAYLFLAEESNENLVIYHQGHKGDFIIGKETIQFFLKQGYSVLALSMPLHGMNNQPIVSLQDHGNIKLSVHNQFFLLDSPQFSSIKFFVEPVAISLNHIDQMMLEFKSYNMVGVSGGGWTTIVYSAIDDRISQNYSVAGMYPAYLQQLYRPADYERIVSQLYDTANVLELFTMSAYGEERKAVQIFNKHDPGVRCGEFYKTYEDDVKLKISQLGKGAFDAHLDDTHTEHKISEHALSIILKHMKDT